MGVRDQQTYLPANQHRCGKPTICRSCSEQDKLFTSCCRFTLGDHFSPLIPMLSESMGTALYLQELCQKEETLNGEIAAASARAKEQLSNEIRRGRRGSGALEKRLLWESLGPSGNDDLVGCNDDLIGFNDGLMGFNFDLNGFNDDLMGFNDDLLGFNFDLIGLIWRAFTNHSIGIHS